MEELNQGGESEQFVRKVVTHQLSQWDVIQFTHNAIISAGSITTESLGHEQRKGYGRRVEPFSVLR